MTNERSGTAPDASVLEVVRALAASTPGIDEEGAPDGTRITQSGRPFVVIRADTVSFRLRPDVARAGLTTPGTRASREGPDWLELDGDRRDRFSRDRAQAWFEFALRLLGS